MDIVEFFVPEMDMVKGKNITKRIDQHTKAVINFKMFTDIPKLPKKPRCIRKKGTYAYKGNKIRRPRKEVKGIFDVAGYYKELDAYN